MRRLFLQYDLFPEPEREKVGSPLLEFSFLLKDGSAVSARYRRDFMLGGHVEFRGGSISGTGYYSHFPPEEWAYTPDDVVIEKAKEAAEMLREARLAEIAKEARKRKKTVLKKGKEK